MERSSFFPNLLASNHPALAHFKKWLFQPGMEFDSPETWWGEKKPRPNPHEGIDLCRFEDAAGQVKELDENIRIPATFAGEVVKIGHDFLGKSIFLRHEIFAADGRQLYTAYGHTQPSAALKVGQKVAPDEIIATIAAPPGKKTAVLPHLHLTLAWMPAAVAEEQLDWQNLGRDPAITLFDPLALLSPPA